MSITSTPQDNDPLIEVRKNELGQDIFVATEILINFFADLTSSSNIESGVIREIVSSANQQQPRNASQIISIARKVEALAGRLGDQSQIARITAIRRELEAADNATQQQVNALRMAVSALQKKQNEIESKQNSLEHLCLSNLVR